MLVYIAGPYSGPGGAHDPSPETVAAIDRNIMWARRAAIFLARARIPFFAPHLNSQHFEVETPDVPPEYWYRADIEILRHCDALLVVNPDWRKSRGTRRELAIARSLGIPVFWSDETGRRPGLDALVRRAIYLNRGTDTAPEQAGTDDQATRLPHGAGGEHPER